MKSAQTAIQSAVNGQEMENARRILIGCPKIAASHANVRVFVMLVNLFAFSCLIFLPASNNF